MKNIKHTYETKASASSIWDLIKTGDDLQRWFPIIATCELKGGGAGATRVCKTFEGNLLIETILKVDHEHRTFQYTIDQHDMEVPTTNIKGTMQVSEGSKSNEISWDLEFDLTGELSDTEYQELENMMRGMMQMGMEGLEKLAVQLSNV